MLCCCVVLSPGSPPCCGMGTPPSRRRSPRGGGRVSRCGGGRRPRRGGRRRCGRRRHGGERPEPRHRPAGPGPADLCGGAHHRHPGGDAAIYDPGSATLREKKVSDLHNRVALVNELPGAVLLSIHQNSLPSSPSTRGPRCSGTARRGGGTGVVHSGGPERRRQRRT